MEPPAQRSGEGGSSPTPPRPVLEVELRRLLYADRLANSDLFLYVHHTARVLARLRKVAPELVAAAEVEVALGIE